VFLIICVPLYEFVLLFIEFYCRIYLLLLEF